MFGSTTIYLEEGRVIKTTKISPSVIEQWYLKKKYLEIKNITLLEKLKSRGVTSKPEILEVYLHFYIKPGFVELSILKVLGVKIDEDSWIPSKYGGGFCSAEIPVNNLFLVAMLPFIKRVGEAESPTTIALLVETSSVEILKISRTINVDALPLTPTIIKIPVDYETAERILKGEVQVKISKDLKILNITKNPPEIILSYTPRAEGKYHFYISIDGEVIKIVITSKGVSKGMIPKEE